MANEEQEHNDHRLHIEACLCGNPAPEVSGDDYDADVMCGCCNRDSDLGFGTRGAINLWNKKIADHKSGKEKFPRPAPEGFYHIRKGIESLQEAAKELSKFPEMGSILETQCRALQQSMDNTQKMFDAMDVPFPSTPTP